ncbi:hypothetical protein ACFOOK_26390 [Micromonospora krabiensis]|uniref:Uncharacterized protein n=1 Tax=Micromonospora krabiensis TaxID=307121 RepID=A0A1C3N5S1_9ACTN|nr:hypothetical protein [Micromonospora krabiensis]SBV27903.1 hypothetical protein GA0070620_3434 [Micromonospora krabiensis]
MAFWSRNREPEPEGATLDWSPAEEVAEDPRIARIIIEHSLDPLNVDHQEIAADMLAMRARIDELVAEWSDSLDARLDAWAPGWRDDMPTQWLGLTITEDSSLPYEALLADHDLLRKV